MDKQRQKIMQAKENLYTLLRRSHEQALSGNAFTEDFVEQFMDSKVYELTHQMDTTRVAEPV